MSANTSSEANRDDGCEWYFGVPFPSKRKAAGVKERELKVGDRVRVVKEGWGEDGSYHCANIGDTDVIEKIYGEKIRCAKWIYFRNEIELLPPTFPSGTRVRVVRNTNRYAVGDTGTVTLSSDESVGLRMDDGRYWSFKPEDLVVVESEAIAHLTMDASGFVTGLSFAPANDPSTPCIVTRLENGQPRPSSWPHVHQSAADATKEAERLASVNPGKQFDVYQRVTGRVGDVQVREVA
jgi:RNase P/RNase MRP subunit p29